MPSDGAIRFMKIHLTIILFLVAISSITWAGINCTHNFNYHFADKLGGKCLTDQSVVRGMKIPLNTIIITPDFEMAEKSTPALVISFSRDDLTQEFLSTFFDPQNRNVRIIHLFAARGVKTILKAKHLIVTLYQGVGFHLRGDIKFMQFMPGFRTFRSDNVMGVVTQVNGEVLISMDQDIIQEKLTDVWSFQIGPKTPCIIGKNCFQREDGTYTGIIPLDESSLLPYFTPRIEK